MNESIGSDGQRRGGSAARQEAEASSAHARSADQVGGRPGWLSSLIPGARFASRERVGCADDPFSVSAVHSASRRAMALWWSDACVAHAPAVLRHVCPAAVSGPRLRLPPLPVTVLISGGRRLRSPAPWHSSDALHRAGGGSKGKPPSFASVIDLDQLAVFDPGAPACRG